MLTHDTARLSTDEFSEPGDQAADDLRSELIAGLLCRQAHTSPKYFYDALGSKLFEAICELSEYYPTRTEAAIFDAHADDIAKSVGRGCTMIDLGAGNCEKAAQLFPALRPAQYVAVDISLDFLRSAVKQLRPRFPQVAMTELGMDFSESLELPQRVKRDKRLFFYPGSSIGNFTPEQTLQFLQRIRRQCHVSGRADGGLLIGVDLVKDKAVLDAAYDDALGVTASFNLNLLLHLNRMLNADFNPRQWQHRGFFNGAQSRIEMHLVAREALTVNWPGGQRHFAQGESIHTENSYKYTQARFLALLAEAGFRKPRVWTDPKNWFLVCHARAA
ncbi:MAG: L-histidine N(alpha)-methyltransferase [Burkholderiaceae bacterium]|nr:L-histidine N(alpha)-methyltransferase [Burkholderiaceae bacterium]